MPLLGEAAVYPKTWGHGGFQMDYHLDSFFQFTGLLICSQAASHMVISVGSMFQEK